ncbi:MAG: feruloyl-CoA synthase, partial [Gammaproteobacteria bacterium]|nr:feruloyl-CoA synthase [Gammaproteobacteria bacterium]
YLTGDAGRLAEASEPSKGVVFDGRTAENFKLEMGTWVTVGMLRVQIIAVAGDVIQDLVITGHDRRHIGILIFPNEAGMRNLVAHEDKGMPLDQLLSHDKVVTALQIGLARHNQEKPASSTRVSLAMFLREPPSIDANEITDKGYLNQRAVLERRHESVQRLYDGGAGCIQIDEGAAPLASQ